MTKVESVKTKARLDGQSCERRKNLFEPIEILLEFRPVEAIRQCQRRDTMTGGISACSRCQKEGFVLDGKTCEPHLVAQEKTHEVARVDEEFWVLSSMIEADMP